MNQICLIIACIFFAIGAVKQIVAPEAKIDFLCAGLACVTLSLIV